MTGSQQSRGHYAAPLVWNLCLAFQEWHFLLTPGEKCVTSANLLFWLLWAQVSRERQHGSSSFPCQKLAFPITHVVSLLYSFLEAGTRSDFQAALKTTTKTLTRTSQLKFPRRALASVAQLLGASSRAADGCGFDSWSGHVPGLWVRSPVGSAMGGNQTMFLSLSLALSPPLINILKIKKTSLPGIQKAHPVPPPLEMSSYGNPSWVLGLQKLPPKTNFITCSVIKTL